MSSEFREIDVCMLLNGSQDKKVSEMSKDAALVKSLVKVFNATLDLANESQKGTGALAMSLSRKALSVSNVAVKATGSKQLELMNFAGGQMLKTIGLTKLATMTPAKASIYITFAMAEKIVSAAGLAGVDKCKLAVASLATTTGAGALTCFASGAFTMGIGCVAGAIAIASDAFDVYGQCHGK